MNDSLKNSNIWEIVFRESSYEIFKELGVFEDQTKVIEDEIKFNDDKRKIIFSGRLTSYYNWMEGVFNFRVGHSEKWLRIFRGCILSINGIDIGEIVKWKEVVITEKKQVPDLPGWIEVSGW